MNLRTSQTLLIAALLAGGSPVAALAQTFQELHAFTPFALDGDGPDGGLIQASDGNFYGTTFYGGVWDRGIVFRMTPNGTLTALASFNGTNNDQNPISTLIEARDGNFYGTTVFPSGIFRMTPSGMLTLVGSGSGTAYELCQGTDGWLYVARGPNYAGNFGYLFRFHPQTGHSELLYEFDYGDFQNGWAPSGGLIQARDGNFYGVTAWGGPQPNWCGTVFRITSNGTLTRLVSFPCHDSNSSDLLMRHPYGRLLQASDGNFYGFAEGGYYGSGAIFRVTQQGVLTRVSSFNSANGSKPAGGLIEGKDGNFYGACTHGGTNFTPGAAGTVFRMTPDGEITALISFSGNGGPFPGATPYAGVVQGSDGHLYGTTGTRGSRGAGNVFRILMPGPQLSIRSVGDQLVLSWRTNYVGFTLQHSDNPASSNWTDSAMSLVSAGGHFWVTNSLQGSSRFYRLRR